MFRIVFQQDLYYSTFPPESILQPSLIAENSLPLSPIGALTPVCPLSVTTIVNFATGKALVKQY